MSNLLGVFISPVTTSLLFRSSGTSFKLDILSLLIELLTIIALPMVIGYVTILIGLHRSVLSSSFLLLPVSQSASRRC